MALKFPDPPKESVSALRSSLARLATSAIGGMAAVHGLKADELGGAKPSMPHQVFSLGLDNLIGGAGLEEAKPVAWRYLVGTGTAAVASAEVNVDPVGGGHKFAQINSGPFSAGTLAAIESLERDSRIASNSYEVRVLRVPALYVTAVWLKNKAQGPDVIVPLAPTNPIFEAGHFYGPEEFENLLRRAADQKPPSPGPTASR